jgi:hypothetical protein
MRSRSSAPSRVDAPWRRSNRDAAVSNLLNEVLLRLAKAGLAILLGGLLYWLITGPLAVPGSAELALLSFLAGAAFILLVQESPI